MWQYRIYKGVIFEEDSSRVNTLEDIEKCLAGLGADGWELVSVLENNAGNYKAHIHYLKRWVAD